MRLLDGFSRGRFGAISHGFAAASIPATSVTSSPSVTASPESDVEKSIRKKHKKHFNISIGDHDLTGEDAEEKSSGGDHGDHDIPALVVPIVAVVFLSIFGAPVLIVAVILYFGFSKSRMQHRTVSRSCPGGPGRPMDRTDPAG